MPTCATGGQQLDNILAVHHGHFAYTGHIGGGIHGEGAAHDKEVVGVHAGDAGGHLKLADDVAVVLNGDMDRCLVIGRAVAAVHVEGHAVLMGDDGGAADVHRAAAVGQGVVAHIGLYQIRAVQRHVNELQIAVVLDQHFHGGGVFSHFDGAVLQGDIVIIVGVAGPLEVEALRLIGAGADGGVFHSVCVAAEVNGEGLGLDLACLWGAERADAAGGVLEQLDGAAIGHGRHSCLQGFVLCAVYLGYLVRRPDGGRKQRQGQHQRQQDACQFFHSFSSFPFLFWIPFCEHGNAARHFHM